MTNDEKLRCAFARGLGLEREAIHDGLTYGSSRWDSIAHMALIVEIEKAFDIMIDVQDTIDLSSYARSKEILAKYDIRF